jgi:hypothetical protein
MNDIDCWVQQVTYCWMCHEWHWLLSATGNLCDILSVVWVSQVTLTMSVDLILKIPQVTYRLRWLSITGNSIADCENECVFWNYRGFYIYLNLFLIIEFETVLYSTFLFFQQSCGLIWNVKFPCCSNFLQLTSDVNCVKSRFI